MVVRLYGKEAQSASEYSLFRLQQRFIAMSFKSRSSGLSTRWQKKLDQYKLAA